MKTSIKPEKAKKERKKRGRKRLAEKVLKSIDVKEKKGNYYVVYDFYTGKIPKEFYIQLDYLREEGYFILRMQRSLIYTSSKRCALALKEIVKHYGGEVKVIRAVEEF